MTNPSLYFTRATLRRDVPAAALRALLLPVGDSARAGAGHKVVWTLFGDSAERERDFLWREADAGVYYFLSRRPPEDRHELFEVDTPKPFNPRFETGDRLRFSLRANATVSRKERPDQQRGKPCDVVMDALYQMPKEARAEARRDVIRRAGTRWLAAQGERNGFGVIGGAADVDNSREGETSCAAVTAYRTLRVEHGGPTARIGVLDFEGEIEVRDPKR